ncbi:restriction endonuclease subunit S [Candidatus Woesearchaeota archaeon]|nr:restriction endonuclease subunit S [Candidatus Woesearchaeota archaeon]
MNTYSEYKDSGIDWIGKIPKSWQVKKLKYIADIKTGDKDTVDREDDGKYPFFVRSQTVEKISSYSFDGEAVLTAGDGVGVGKVFHYINGKFDYHQRVYGIKNFKDVNGRYFYYFLKENLRKEIARNNAKSTVDSLRLPMFKDFHVTFGNIDEQKKIVDFLDSKSERIKEFVHKKKELIELLKAQRISLINQVITKGLNRTVELKESNITWIGKFPKHWIIKKLKYNTYIKGRIGWQALKTDEFVDEGPYCVTGTDFKEGEINWNSCYHVGEERWAMDKFIQLKEKDLVITKDGTIGKIAIVKNLNGKACLNSGVFVTRPKNEDYITEYMYWVLNSTIFTEFINFEKKGTTISHLYQNVFENMPYTQPPISEQKEIVKFLDQETSQIDKSIEKIQKEIGLLEEYKEALISEAVTGKIKVTHE